MNPRSTPKYALIAGVFGLLGHQQTAAADPANAGTLKEIIAHGVVMSVSGTDIDIAFTPDGKFTALGSTGSWHIDGEQLCSKSDVTLVETCAVYPAGKKSGDTFTIDAPGTVVTIRIK
jgi:hypothetical protein